MKQESYNSKMNTTRPLDITKGIKLVFFRQVSVNEKLIKIL